MMIILVRIHANTTKKDINNFMSPVLKGGMFQKTGYIERIKFMVLKDGANNILESHGIVTIDSEVAGERAILKLNRKKFKGKYIAVRKYHIRSRYNDPRINRRELSEALVNKRKVDRRRLAFIEDFRDSITYAGLDGFQQNFLGPAKDA